MYKMFPVLLVLLSTLTPLRADEPLPRDDGNVYGQFDNGLKYIIRHNANPPGRVNLYLHVKTGALNESNDQNGLAHFLEHMAFNGSTHFPPGKLLPLLGSLGMTFGADTNAHTNLWETLYKLNLPDTKPQTIDLAAQIFSDYASGLNLSDAEIENERKIILEEYRSREGVGQRVRKQTYRDVFAGTKLATHDVIGDVEQIKAFPAASFRDYYNKWYRPENMTLIVVGDIKPEDVLPAATKWLSGISARTPATQPQQAGLKPTTQPRAFVYTDAEMVAASVDLTKLGAGEPPVRTFEQYRRDVLRAVASGIVNRRYRNLVAAGRAPFREASADIGTFLTEVTTASAEATGEPQDWQKILAGLIGEVDRALEHGFTDEEAKLIVRGLLADAEQAVTAEATRDSTGVINGIARKVGMDEPILSAAQELTLLRRATADLKTIDLDQLFAEAFDTRAYDYVVSLPARPGLKVPTPADVLTVAEATWSAQTEVPATQRSSGDLLAGELVPGTVTGQETDADLKITTATFANGVVMHHKFSDYKKDRVLVSLVLPGGQLEETEQNRGVSELAGSLLDRPATSRFTSTEVADLLTGKTVSIEGGIGRDSLALSLTASNKDLPAGLQLAHALLTDARLEQAVVEDWKKAQLQEIAKNEREPRGQLQRILANTVYGNDPRFRPLTIANVNAATRETAEAWFKRIASGSAIEVTVVGDIPLEQATTLVAQYVGSLPKRERGFDALNPLRKLDRGNGPFEASVTFDSVTPQALAVSGFIGSDENNLDRRPLTLAAEVLTNRMIDRIREKEQLVYSIGARHQPGRGLPGTGLFSAGSMTDPANSAKLADTVLEMLNAFAKTGPTDDELSTAKRQIMTEITTTMREPAWWLTQISESRYRNRPLSDLKVLPGVFETFDKETVRATVAKYLRPETTVRLIATPKPAGGPATKPASQPTP
ncbi:MAG TPA: insulinase family protein [Tepidisphaeraceae bacterium]|jgi:zinc protease